MLGSDWSGYIDLTDPNWPGLAAQQKFIAARKAIRANNDKS